jgi:glutamate-1-semialdehyde aminotransferase
MLERGVMLPPSPMECWMVSAAHDTDAVEETLYEARAALAAIGG